MFNVGSLLAALSFMTRLGVGGTQYIRRHLPQGGQAKIDEVAMDVWGLKLAEAVVWWGGPRTDCAKGLWQRTINQLAINSAVKDRGIP